MGSFDSKIALITGGSSGIGRAAALAFAGEGARVVVADLNEERSESVVREIEEIGGEAASLKVDVSKENEVEAMVGEAVSTFDRLDIAFNNAGVLSRETAPIEDCSVEEFDRVLRINLRSVFLCMKFELRQMRRKGKGAIVNTASIHGVIGAGHGISAYIASKHGVVGLTRAAALEYARDNIRVNAVCPGHIDTPLIAKFLSDAERRENLIESYPLKRIGTAEEIAATVLWLASDAASFVTGQTIAVDGGFLAQ